MPAPDGQPNYTAKSRRFQLRNATPSYPVQIAARHWMDGSLRGSLRSSPLRLSQWKCRLCGFDRYHRVSVLHKSGARYETPFCACSRCSVMFLNAAQFDANSTENPSVEMPPVVTPMRRRR